MSWNPQQCMYPLPSQIQDLQYYHHDQSVQLESGVILPQLTIGFHSFGTLSKTRDNVIWVCHPLTSNSDIREWWGRLLGPGKLFDTDKYFVVCANVLGSCYGTTGPRSRNPNYGISYGLDFPAFTIRDIAKINLLLLSHLNIDEVALLIGSSFGAHQCLEMAWKIPEQIKRLVLVANGAVETPWAIAQHEARRMAILSDSTIRENRDRAGAAGLKAAKAMELMASFTIPYYQQMAENSDAIPEKFKAATFIEQQSVDFERKFYAQCYYFLLNALDTHNIGRGRGGISTALQQLTMPTTIVGFESDMLIPIEEQVLLANHLPNAQLCRIDAGHGHQSCVTATAEIEAAVRKTMPEVVVE